MPVISSKFSPPSCLKNGHVQTILGAVWPRRIDLDYTTERLELPDTDFLDLDWVRQGNEKVVIISHGLEGSSRNTDIQALAQALSLAGWDVLAWNFRGCSGEPNRLLRFYHSGETGDLSIVISHAAKNYSSLALVGFSLGGNLTLKYLGEASPHPAICGAVAVSAPIDLASSAMALDKNLGNRIYLHRFMKSLKAKVRSKAIRFPKEIDVSSLSEVRGFAKFDDRYTARIHGFQNAEDYWSQSSARQYLPNIRTPSLLINAKNDPFLSKESFPYSEAEKNPHHFLETPDSGGHLGFIDRQGLWLTRRIPEFLSEFAIN